MNRKKKGENHVQGNPGVPLTNEIVPLSEPHLAGNEWNYVKECLDNAWVSSVGSFVDRFERETAALVGSSYAVAVASGTAALHIALLAAGIRPDDEVLVSTLAFIAPANAIRYVGAWPVFMDADPDYWQMDPRKLGRFLETECRSRPDGLYNRASGHRVKGILPVHALGHPCPVDEILEEARKHDLVVVEDAAESLGAQYKGASVGRTGDLGCLSFNGNKIITTGGGGMIVTDDEMLATRAAYLSTQAKDDPVEYIHREIGYNYRLTNIQAAMGCAQLEQLGRHVIRKRQIADTYQRELSGVLGITTMREASWATANFWMYTILVDEALYGTDSRGLMHRLARAGIQSRPLWQPLHLSPAHAGCQSYSCDTAEKLYRQGLSLPSFVGMTESQQALVMEVIRSDAG